MRLSVLPPHIVRVLLVPALTVLATGLLACSQPTPAPTVDPNIPPGPVNPPPVQDPGGYPRVYPPTPVLPYPASDADASGSVTGTMTGTITGTATITATTAP